MTKKVRVHGFKMYEDDLQLIDEAASTIERPQSRAEFFKEAALDRAKRVIKAARRREVAHLKSKRDTNKQ